LRIIGKQCTSTLPDAPEYVSQPLGIAALPDNATLIP
jgi:hypothetical protein